MDDNNAPPELPKSFILLQFESMESTRMTIQINGIVPSQMAIAAWYLQEQADQGLRWEMEQQAQLAAAKHIAIPTTKH